MEQGSIQISSKGVMSLLSSSLFKDAGVFVDEAIQNSLRANARHIYFTLSNYLQIEDDGVGCLFPATLLKIADSGWKEAGDSITAFGIGFWSCLALCKQDKEIQVRSNDWFVSFLPSELIKGRLDVIVERPMPRVEGFSVRLYPDFDKISKEDLELRFRRAVRYKDVSVHIKNRDADYIPQSRMDKSSDLPLGLSFKEDWGEGVLVCAEYWNDESKEYGFKGVELYYEDLFVMKLDLPYVCGAVFAKFGEIDPKAPDKRDIIVNDKFNVFMSKLRVLAKETFKKHLNDIDCDKYDFGLAYYFKPEELVPFVQFELARNIVKEESSQEKGKEERKEIPLSGDLPDVQEKAKREELSFFSSESKIVSVVPTKSVEVNRTPCMNAGVSNAILVKGEKKPRAWVKVTELVTCSDLLTQAQELHIEVVIVKNRIQESVANYLAYVPIREVAKKIMQEVFIKEESSPIAVFERICMLARTVASWFSPETQVKVAKLSAKWLLGEFQVGPEEDLKILGATKDGHIYLQEVLLREVVDKLGYRRVKGERMFLDDIGVLVALAPTLGHEITHILLNTVDGTFAQVSSELKVQESICHRLAAEIMRIKKGLGKDKIELVN